MNEKLLNELNEQKPRSAWDKGIKEQALELVEGAEVELTKDNALHVLLNGADNWYEYSYGGCALIFDSEIAERYCTPRELKRTKGGDLSPNRHEAWIDVQARALNQAYRIIKKVLNNETI